MFSVALSLGSLPVGVTHHHALWSSDFPRLPHLLRRGGAGQRGHLPSCGSRTHYSRARRILHFSFDSAPHGDIMLAQH